MSGSGLWAGSVPIDWAALAPALILVLGAAGVFLACTWRRASRRGLGIATLGILVLAAISSAAGWSSPRSSFDGLVAVDNFGILASSVAYLACALTVLMSLYYLDREPEIPPEYYGLLLVSTSGMAIMATSLNLVGIFLGLEILSIPLYVMSGLVRTRSRALESSMKYFLMGAFSTGFLLYGIAFLYGGSGGFSLEGLALALDRAQGAQARWLMLGLGLLIVGLAFKVAAVPFHFWVPDVYEGAPVSVASFMATGTKAAAFAVLLRVMFHGFGANALSEWQYVMILLAVLTMTVGNLLALGQSNLKRLLAYSSIAHAGYLLIGVATYSKAGAESLLFYLFSYAFMTGGAFGVLALIAGCGADGAEHGTRIDDLAGLGHSRPALAAALCLFMLSLTGIPPTGGFVAKFYLFRSAVEADLLGLAVIGVLNSVIGAFYYLRVIVTVTMRDATRRTPVPSVPSVFAYACVAVALLGTLILGVTPGVLTRLSSQPLF
ncbi:MAG: NADH-quinone oxidoreductase subunit N [Acidobacteriota bacterium]